MAVNKQKNIKKLMQWIFCGFMMFLLLMVMGTPCEAKDGPRSETYVEHKTNDSQRRQEHENFRRQEVQQKGHYGYTENNSKYQYLNRERNAELEIESKQVFRNTYSDIKSHMHKLKNQENLLGNQWKKEMLASIRKIKRRINSQVTSKEKNKTKRRKRKESKDEGIDPVMRRSFQEKCLFNSKEENEKGPKERRESIGVYCSVQKQKRWRERKRTLF